MEDHNQHDTPETAQEAEKILAGYKRPSRWLTGWKLALVITSILVVGVMTLVVIFALTLFKNPTFQGAMEQYRIMVECEENLNQIGGALTRYSKSTDEFPEKLEDLIPDYLANDSVFRCPADKDSKAPSYAYVRPKMSAADDTVMCACPRHRVLKNQPALMVELRKDGKVTHTPVKETK